MKRQPEVKIYNSKNGLRWNVPHPNGHKLANCGQGYSRRIDMEKAMRETAAAIGRYFAGKG